MKRMKGLGEVSASKRPKGPQNLEDSFGQALLVLDTAAIAELCQKQAGGILNILRTWDIHRLNGLIENKALDIIQILYTCHTQGIDNAFKQIMLQQASTLVERYRADNQIEILFGLFNLPDFYEQAMIQASFTHNHSLKQFLTHEPFQSRYQRFLNTHIQELEPVLNDAGLNKSDMTDEVKQVIAMILIMFRRGESPYNALIKVAYQLNPNILSALFTYFVSLANQEIVSTILFLKMIDSIESTDEASFLLLKKSLEVSVKAKRFDLIKIEIAWLFNNTLKYPKSWTIKLVGDLYYHLDSKDLEILPEQAKTVHFRTYLVNYHMLEKDYDRALNILLKYQAGIESDHAAELIKYLFDRLAFKDLEHVLNLRMWNGISRVYSYFNYAEKNNDQLLVRALLHETSLALYPSFLFPYVVGRIIAHGELHQLDLMLKRFPSNYLQSHFYDADNLASMVNFRTQLDDVKAYQKALKNVCIFQNVKKAFKCIASKAAYSGNFGAMQAFLSDYYFSPRIGKYNNEVIVQAVRGGQLEMVKYLLEHIPEFKNHLDSIIKRASSCQRHANEDTYTCIAYLITLGGDIKGINPRYKKVLAGVRAKLADYQALNYGLVKSVLSEPSDNESQLLREMRHLAEFNKESFDRIMHYLPFMNTRYNQNEGRYFSPRENFEYHRAFIMDPQNKICLKNT